MQRLQANTCPRARFALSDVVIAVVIASFQRRERNNIPAPKSSSAFMQCSPSFHCRLPFCPLWAARSAVLAAERMSFPLRQSATSGQAGGLAEVERPKPARPFGGESHAFLPSAGPQLSFVDTPIASAPYFHPHVLFPCDVKGVQVIVRYG